MGKRMKRAFEIMNERNRRYLEKAADKDKQNSLAADAAEPGEPDITENSDLPDSPEAGTALSPEEAEELRRAEEKLRAYREANGMDPDAPIPDGPVSDGLPDPDRIERERKEGERKAKEFHAEKLELEKGDIPALIISALLVFGPIFLVLGAVVVLAWFFLH